MTELSPSPIPRWLEIARKEIGVKETPGPKATSRIVEYLTVTPLAEGGQSDETAWCSSFVNWVMKQAGIRGTGSAAAKSWLTWGESRSHRPGAVVVIKRIVGRSPVTTSGYHVGFFVSGNGTTITLLGGNQSDSVKESVFSLGKWDVLACRWPMDERA